MPLGINGSGTITGLAVGGLPNGVVDEDTLATDSVTNAKVSNNAINTNEIVNSAVTGAKLGAGTVLQTVYATTTTEEANSNSSYITWFGCTWTPISSTSHKIITVNAIRLIVGAADMEANFRITDGSNVTYRYRIFNDNVSGNLWLNPCLTWYWEQTHTAGQSVTFSAQCRDGNNSGSNVYWGDNGATSMMIIQEIAR